MTVADQLEGKVVVITGGDQGIGRAIVQRFAQEDGMSRCANATVA
jgi:NAD(P)-dependent dehydrogenase (short-subunit alcohol dehydrogenase family)